MSNSSVITCVAWIKKGDSASFPRYTLKEGDTKDFESRLAASIEKEDAKQWSSDSDDSDSGEEIPMKKKKTVEKVDKKTKTLEEESLEGLEKFNLENYDEDEEEEDAGDGYKTDFASLAVFVNNKEDPYMTNMRDEEDNVEEDDFELKPDDNLIIVGRTEEDGAILEVYVFNEDEDSLYVHHDILLPSFPLALEPVKPDIAGQGNYIAVGYITPNIDIWDLNLVDSLEPAFSLGTKKKKSKKIKTKSMKGHTDAVLDLSWNHNVCNVLASSSADKSVALWDMKSQKMLSSLTHHTDKVQSIEWHPFEGQCLLTGGCDGLVAAIDCRSPKEPAKSWQIDGEVEKIIWNHFKPQQFFVSSDKGVVQSFDIRTDKQLFTLKAHEDAVTCMSMSHFYEGAIVTVSADHSCKLWRIKDNKPSLLATKEPKMGTIHCSAFCPDNPTLLALGGARDSLRTFDFQDECGHTFKEEHFATKILKDTDDAISSEDR